MAALPEASTVVRATVEGSTVVGAALLEAATEVAAEATVAESTHSIRLHPAKSQRASWANRLAQLHLSLRSPRLFVAVISFVFGFDGNLGASCRVQLLTVPSYFRVAGFELTPEGTFGCRYNPCVIRTRISIPNGMRSPALVALPYGIVENLENWAKTFVLRNARWVLQCVGVARTTATDA